MKMSRKKEINIQIDKDSTIIYKCEEALLSINTILNSLKLLKHSINKIYRNEANEELASIILVAKADMLSMKSELEDVASETADEIRKLKNELEVIDGSQE